jgi:hypothetical protein
MALNHGDLSFSKDDGARVRAPLLVSRCYINFIAEFLAAEESATRAAAIAARAELKEMDVPKDYASWVKVRARRR